MGLESIAKAFATAEKEEAVSALKETKRLEKIPFKTKIEPFSKDTLENLKGWKEPMGAYVLFEKKYREFGMNLDGEIRFTLHTLPVEARPDQTDKLRYNVMVKGMRILHWGKFPTINDADPRRALKAKSHVNPETGLCAWDVLDKVCQSYCNQDGPSKDKTIDELTRKLAEATAKANKTANKAESANG